MKRLVALIVLTCGACNVDLSIDGDAAIECKKPADCPAGFRCSSTLGMCVRTTAPDESPPELVEASVTPDVASAKTVLRAELTVSEPLHQDPAVQIVGVDGATFLLVEKDASTSEPRYVFDYAVSGSESEGPHEVAVVGLVDRFGNENPSASLDIVTLDFTAPEDAAIATVPAGKTGSATIDVSLSATGADEVLLGGDTEDAATWRPFATTLQVNLTSRDGAKTLFARFRDEAGNESLGVSTSVLLDTTPPTGSLVLALTSGRQAVASGGQLVVTGGASADATATGTQVVVLDGSGGELDRIDVAAVALDDSLFSGSITLPALASGAASLTLETTLDDGANQTTLTSDPVTIDDVAPTGLTFHFTSGAPSSLYTPRASTPASLEIANPGQTGLGDLEMRFSGAGLAVDDPLRDHWVPFSAAPTLTLDATPGTKTVSVTVRDQAHNAVGPETATITLDTDPPTSPVIAIQGPDPTSSTFITVTVSAVDADQIIVYSADVVPATGKTSEWIAVPASGEVQDVQLTAVTGAKSINARFRDLAGNVSDTVSDAVTFSSSLPVSSPTLQPPGGQSRTKWGDVLAIGGSAWTGAVIETARLVFYDGTSAIVGERALAIGSEVFLDSGTGNFSGSVTLQQAETPGAAVDVCVEIVIRLAGGACPDDCSAASGSRSQKIRIDNQPPDNPALAIQEGLVVNFRSLTASLGVDNAGEPGWADIEVRLSGTGVHSSTPDYNTWIPWVDTMPVELTTGDGTKPVDVSYRDGAHHVVSAPQVLVDYDTTPPDIATVTVTGGGGVAGMTNTPNVDVTVSATGAPIQVRISGSGVEPGAYSAWTDYDFASAIPVVLSAGDASKAITVEIRDQALNEALDDTTSILLDTIGPLPTLVAQLADAGAGKTHLHSGDLGFIDVWGSANEADCTIASAELLGDTGSGLVHLRDLSVPAEVAASPATGDVSGSFQLGVADLSAYQNVLLQVVFDDQLGNASPSGLSRSNLIGVDNVPPQGTNLILAPGQDPTNETLVQVEASSTDAIGVCFFGADTVAGGSGCSTSEAFQPLLASLVGAVELRGTTQGANTIWARFRDRAFNEVDLSVGVTFDNIAPSFASAASWVSAEMDGSATFLWNAGRQIGLQFQASDADPVTIGISGAVDTAATGCDSVADSTCFIRFAGCQTSCVAPLTLAGDDLGAVPPEGCFDGSSITGDGPKSVAFRLLDDAGNASASGAIAITLDRSCPDSLTLDPATTPPVQGAGHYVSSTAIRIDLLEPSEDADMAGYRLGCGGSYSDVDAPPFVFNLDNDQAYTLCVRGRDVGGHVGPQATFDVIRDTTSPSTPRIGPDGVTFNGDTFAVVVLDKSIDAGGAADGSDVTYQVVGGPYGEWEDVAFANAAALAYATFPTFDVAGMPQQGGATLTVRARDIAGNVSGADSVSLVEETARVETATQGILQDLDFSTSFGLWGDHLVWSDIAPTTVYHTDLGGLTHVLWTSLSPVVQARQEIDGFGRLAFWLDKDGSGQTVIFGYDLGPDERFLSGDEGFFLTNEAEPVIALPSCGTAATLDYDGATSELAYVSDTGCRDLMVADTSAYAGSFVTAVACNDCVAPINSRVQIAIAGSCIVFPDAAGELQQQCRVGAWGSVSPDDPDVTTPLTHTGGDCTNPVNFALGVSRSLDMKEIDGDLVAVWTESDGSSSAVCMWRESSPAAVRIPTSGPLTVPFAGGFASVILDESGSVFIAENTGEAPSTQEAVYRYAIATDELARLPITSGQLGRFRASGGRLAFSHVADGDSRVRVFEPLDERQVTAGAWDNVAPDVDGDRAVWVSYRDHACGEIYMLDRQLGGIFPLTDTSCPGGAGVYKVCPQISGDYVVWHGNVGSGPPTSCTGEVYGLDLSAGPPFASTPIWISELMAGAAGIWEARVSGPRVILRARGVSGRYLYGYTFALPGTKPALAAPLTTEQAGPADIDGDNVVYVYWEDDAANYRQIRMCSFDAGCAAPATVVPAYNESCTQAANLDRCYYKYAPRLSGRTLVWLDNRAMFDTNGLFDNQVEYYLYGYEIPVVVTPGSGTKLSTTPWASFRTGTENQPATMVEQQSTDDLGWWDAALPSIGREPDRPPTENAFVVMTSLRKDLEQGLGDLLYYREVVRIDLGGPNALVERTLTSTNTCQMAPAADASGSIVWQDRRDGLHSQIVWMSD